MKRWLSLFAVLGLLVMNLLPVTIQAEEIGSADSWWDSDWDYRNVLE